ncbi:MAG TPA: hypothetical protein VHF51_18940 [Solirubrobacteraceae bacterium]|nr:hypothetical protein [Solirubrobacteraceae bacterium]
MLLLTYVKPLGEVDALMREHVAWLNEQYDGPLPRVRAPDPAHQGSEA